MLNSLIQIVLKTECLINFSLHTPIMPSVVGGLHANRGKYIEDRSKAFQCSFSWSQTLVTGNQRHVTCPFCFCFGGASLGFHYHVMSVTHVWCRLDLKDNSNRYKTIFFSLFNKIRVVQYSLLRNNELINLSKLFSDTHGLLLSLPKKLISFFAESCNTSFSHLTCQNCKLGRKVVFALLHGHRLREAELKQKTGIS